MRLSILVCLFIPSFFFAQLLCLADSGKGAVDQAAALIRGGKLKQAEDVLRQASAADPNSSTLHGKLGEVLFKEHNYQEAAIELGQAAQQEPGSREYNLMAAEALIGWQHYSTAVDFLKAIEPRFAKDFQFHYDLGVAYFYIGNVNAAQSELEESLRISPNYDRAEFMLANCVGYGDPGKAIALFRKLANEHPDISFYWASLGQMQGRAGNWPEALTAVKKALAVAPNDVNSQLAASAVFVESGDYASARPVLERLEKSHPQIMNVHVLLVRVYQRSGEPAKAKSEAEIASRLRREQLPGQSQRPPEVNSDQPKP